ncbi:MAG TPA: hypothetical protein VKQ72_00320 [Aggregatilineales bacterium]|nr:hypothetical protein [Aggregatilineales bacterium]
MDKRQISVRVDDRVRLMSAVLAGTNYPDKSQERRKHGTHLHARGTRKAVAEHTHHPAVQAMQVLLDQSVPLASIYNYVLRLTWPGLRADDMPRWVPPKWNEQLKHFYEVTNLAKWWADEAENWKTAQRHLVEAFAKVDLYGFLDPFVGPIVETLVFMPNISYPSDQNIGFRIGGELVVIAPPPMAWGDSPPWPYKDDEALAYRAALDQYLRILMSSFMHEHEDLIKSLAEKPLPVDDKFALKHPTWQDQFLGLFSAALIHLFLEDSVSSLEAKSFMQHMQKVEGVTILPGIVSIFRRYLDEYKLGHYTNLADYLPNFPKQIRVARTIATL